MASRERRWVRRSVLASGEKIAIDAACGRLIFRFGFRDNAGEDAAFAGRRCIRPSGSMKRSG